MTHASLINTKLLANCSTYREVMDTTETDVSQFSKVERDPVHILRLNFRGSGGRGDVFTASSLPHRGGMGVSGGRRALHILDNSKRSRSLKQGT